MLAAAPVVVARTDAHEGPVYLAAEHALFATSVRRPGPHTVILRIELDGGGVEELPTGAVMANGMSHDHDGRLIVCEQGDVTHDACISRIDPRTGQREVIADHWDGHRLSSPNDVVVDPGGAVWFTDPDYGHLQGFRPAPEKPNLVHRWDPGSGIVTAVADGFDEPNGIAMSPDGFTLYVTDSGSPRRVVAFDVDLDRLDGDRLERPRVLTSTPESEPDGLEVDADGRVYVSRAEGVLVLTPDGDRLGVLPVPGAVNFTFGPDQHVLYVTADTAVWSVRLDLS